MISLHFIVRFPIVLSTVYLIYICRKKITSYIWPLIPLTLFIYIFILNKNINLDYNYEENLYLVKEVFFRAGSEGFLNYQPIWRIIFLYSAFFFSLFIISKYKYYEFKIYLYF